MKIDGGGGGGGGSAFLKVKTSKFDRGQGLRVQCSALSSSNDIGKWTPGQDGLSNAFTLCQSTLFPSLSMPASHHNSHNEKDKNCNDNNEADNTPIPIGTRWFKAWGWIVLKYAIYGLLVHLFGKRRLCGQRYGNTQMLHQLSTLDHFKYQDVGFSTAALGGKLNLLK